MVYVRATKYVGTLRYLYLASRGNPTGVGFKMDGLATTGTAAATTPPDPEPAPIGEFLAEFVPAVRLSIPTGAAGTTAPSDPEPAPGAEFLAEFVPAVR